MEIPELGIAPHKAREGKDSSLVTIPRGVRHCLTPDYIKTPNLLSGPTLEYKIQDLTMNNSKEVFFSLSRILPGSLTALKTEAASRESNPSASGGPEYRSNYKHDPVKDLINKVSFHAQSWTTVSFV